MSAIVLYFIYYTYLYLRQLESCECAIRYRKDIIALKDMELILLVLNVFMIAGSVFDYKLHMKLNGALVGIFMLIEIVFLGIFINHTYHLYHKMPKNCDCFNKYPRYFLYLQAISYSITLISVPITIIMAGFAIHK
jgi:hypothetical protein